MPNKSGAKLGTGTAGFGLGPSLVSTSDSHLVRPDTPAHKLAAEFLKNRVFMPDPEPLYVTMGALAGNMLSGNPVWLMLTGPSSSGKTLILKSLIDLEPPRVRMVSSIKGEASFLSGTKKKDWAEGATGGLLTELGDNGCMLFMDFTSVLSSSKEALLEIVKALRELYDGTWSRDIGGEGGRHLEHKGKVALIAGVTHTIDRATDVVGEMGMRWLMYRMPDSTGYQEAMAAINQVNPSGMGEALQTGVRKMFEECGLSFKEPGKRRVFSEGESHVLVSIAQFGARARSPVPRDNYSKQVLDVAQEEAPSRFAQGLTQLWAGMEAIGCSERECRHAMGKIVMDSMSQVRQRIIKAIVQGMKQQGEIAVRAKLSVSAAQRGLEDLEMLRVVEKIGEGRGAEYGLGEWSAERLEMMGVFDEYNMTGRENVIE